MIWDLLRLQRHRVRWILGGLALAMFFSVRPILAADLSGTWDLTCRLGDDRQIISLELIHDGSRLAGSGTIRMENTGAGVPVELRVGRVRGRDFSFSLLEIGRPGARPQYFDGSWFRNEMSGLSTGAFGARVFRGDRRSRKR